MDTPSSIKPRFPRATGIGVARELCSVLKLVTEPDGLLVAGSLRRWKDTVADVEILYIPMMAPGVPADLFGDPAPVNLADRVIEGLIDSGVLEKRKNSVGSFMFGTANKLVRHVATGMPVDLFAATWANWWNYRVCRTGPAELNTRIATLAKDRGWKWNPYGAGFTNLDTNEEVAMESEEAVFAFVGLPYAEPHLRK